MAKMKKKKTGPARFEIQEVAKYMGDMFDLGAHTGILYFKNGLRGQLTSDGNVTVAWQSDIKSPYKDVYAAPVNYNYQPYVTPKAEMYPEDASESRSN